jgi:hypothetical protein
VFFGIFLPAHANLNLWPANHFIAFLQVFIETYHRGLIGCLVSCADGTLPPGEFSNQPKGMTDWLPAKPPALTPA